jgi:hypothetical protein
MSLRVISFVQRWVSRFWCALNKEPGTVESLREWVVSRVKPALPEKADDLLKSIDNIVRALTLPT